jgi:predicted alpha/beta superfamily hydrolase
MGIKKEKLKMKITKVFVGLVIVVVAGMGCLIEADVGDVVIGERGWIKSEILKETRGYSVYLPESYEKVEKRFPVLVVLDGDDYFHFLTGVVEYYARLGTIPQMVVVGIDSGNRFRDFTPTRAGIPGGKVIEGSGGGPLFGRFIEEELLPVVEKNYRVSGFRVLCGHSVAGLFVVERMVFGPGSFSGFVATSPSLWWDREYVGGEAMDRLAKDKARGRVLFLAVGNEGGTLEGPIVNFTKVLEKHPGDGIDWTFRRFEGVNHQAMPVKAFAYGLEHVFGDWVLPEAVFDEGVDAVLAYYGKLSKKYLETVEAPEHVLNRLGYRMLRKGVLEEAIRIFEINAAQYPQSANAYDSLGEAYMKRGYLNEAIRHYRKSLKLDPQNDNARKMLRKLEMDEGAE